MPSTLGAQADELGRKQTALESLSERLGQVDELGKRTSSQHDALLESRADLDQLRTDIQDFHKSHAEVARLRDAFASDRAAIEAFGEWTTALLARTPELESRMDAVLGKMALVEEGTRSATRLGELAAELDSQMTRVGARLQFIEKLESRINSLHVVTSDVDRKFREQLARMNELYTLKSALDTVGTHVVDTQQKLDSVAAQQHKIVPLAAEVARLAESVTHTQLLVASMEMLGERKAVVDHIGEKLARLDFMVQEAQNTLRALQGEREVAERIEQSIKSLRARTTVGESKTA